MSGFRIGLRPSPTCSRCGGATYPNESLCSICFRRSVGVPIAIEDACPHEVAAAYASHAGPTIEAGAGVCEIETATKEAVDNLKRKQAAAEAMAGEMAKRVSDVLRAELTAQTSRMTTNYEPRVPMTVPRWVNSQEEASL